MTKRTKIIILIVALIVIAAASIGIWQWKKSKKAAAEAKKAADEAKTITEETPTKKAPGVVERELTPNPALVKTAVKESPIKDTILEAIKYVPKVRVNAMIKPDLEEIVMQSQKERQGTL